jgi:hypothetical protein
VPFILSAWSFFLVPLALGVVTKAFGFGFVKVLAAVELHRSVLPFLPPSREYSNTRPLQDYPNLLSHIILLFVDFCARLQPRFGTQLD